MINESDARVIDRDVRGRNGGREARSYKNNPVRGEWAINEDDSKRWGSSDDHERKSPL